MLQPSSANEIMPSGSSTTVFPLGFTSVRSTPSRTTQSLDSTYARMASSPTAPEYTPGYRGSVSSAADFPRKDETTGISALSASSLTIGSRPTAPLQRGP